MLTIAHRVRELNGAADLVYCLYMNYATSTAWGEWVGPLQDYFIDKLDDTLRLMRASIDPDADIVLVDIFGATEGEDLDPLLIGEVHFSDAGHQDRLGDGFKFFSFRA